MKTKSLPQKRRATAPLFGWLALGGVAYFAAAVLLLHVLRPDVDPMARVTSEYAVGPHGLIMTSAFLAFSVALGALGVGFSRALGLSIGRTPGLVLLLIAAAAVVLAAIFPVDVGAVRPVTRNGWVHRVAAIVAFASMAVAPILLVPRLHKLERWRGVAILGGGVGAAGLVGLGAIQAMLLERGLAGAAQRVILALFCGWVLVAASRMLRPNRLSASTKDGLYGLRSPGRTRPEAGRLPGEDS